MAICQSCAAPRLSSEFMAILVYLSPTFILNCWFSHSDMTIQYIPPADWAVNACYHLTQEKEQGHSLCDRPPSETKVKGQTLGNVALQLKSNVLISRHRSSMHVSFLRCYSSPVLIRTLFTLHKQRTSRVTLLWHSGIFMRKRRRILHKLFDWTTTATAMTSKTHI